MRVIQSDDAIRRHSIASQMGNDNCVPIHADARNHL